MGATPSVDASVPETRLLRRALLLHPVTLAALVLWLVNDHILKGVFPGVFTGKASDVAGLVAFPVVLLATCPERLVARLGVMRAAWLSVAAVAAVFVAINVSETLSNVVGYLLSLVPRAFAALRSRSFVPLFFLGPSGHVADLPDLYVLPFVLVPAALAHRRRLG